MTRRRRPAGALSKSRRKDNNQKPTTEQLLPLDIYAPETVEALVGIADRVIVELERDITIVCRDLPEIPLVCVTHASVGLGCILCWSEHILRHEGADEWLCTVCGAHSEQLEPVVLPIIARGLPAKTTAGELYALHGRLLIGGIGLCTRCATRRVES